MSDSHPNPAKEKSYAFALRSIGLYKYLSTRRSEYVMSKQMLRSATSIGANVAEANQAQSRADFVSKLSIALKEAVESEYWLSLLRDAGYITKPQAESLLKDCVELIRLLTASIRTTKRKHP